MALTVADIPGRVSELLGGRVARWTPLSRQTGDYDGRERTIEVFDAQASEQRALLRQLRPARPEIECLLGGPLIVVFHTPRETERLYPEFSRARGYSELAAVMAEWIRSPHPDQPGYDPDDIEGLDLEEAA